MSLTRLCPTLVVAVLLAAACWGQVQGSSPAPSGDSLCSEETDVELWGGEDDWENAPGFLEKVDRTGQVGLPLSVLSEAAARSRADPRTPAAQPGAAALPYVQDRSCCDICAKATACIYYNSCGDGYSSACHLFSAGGERSYSSKASGNKANNRGCVSAVYTEGAAAAQVTEPAPAGNPAAPVFDSVSGGGGEGLGQPWLCALPRPTPQALSASWTLTSNVNWPRSTAT